MFVETQEEDLSGLFGQLCIDELPQFRVSSFLICLRENGYIIHREQALHTLSYLLLGYVIHTSVTDRSEQIGLSLLWQRHDICLNHSGKDIIDDIFPFLIVMQEPRGQLTESDVMLQEELFYRCPFLIHLYL